jgi:hypothetical protein
VSLDELPDDIPSYGGFDLYVEYAGVTASEDANNDDWGDCGFPAAFNGDGFVGWGCAIGVPPAGPSSWIGAIGSITFTCTQSGSLSLVHGAGDKTDLIEMVAENEEGVSESVIHSEGADVSETITIECGTLPAETPGEVTQGTPGGPGPTPGPIRTTTGGGQTPGAPEATLEPTAAAQATFAAADSATATAEAGGAPTEEPPGGEGEDDDDSNVWIWIVVGVVVAAVVIGGGGYWYMRSRGGGTPPTGGGGTSGSAGGPVGPGDGGAGPTGGDAGGSASSGGGTAPTPTPSDAGSAGNGDGGGTVS